jgi:hypothetical protein
MVNGRKKCVESQEVEGGSCVMHAAGNIGLCLVRFKGMQLRSDCC